MYNPFKKWRISGSWYSHVGFPAFPAKGSSGYSAGGIDHPLPNGTDLPAPASGILRISGGHGEFAAGWVGSAGRRSILELDTPIRDLVAIVFQHQSEFGKAKWYGEGQTLGKSGASANRKERGGDYHLHSHGLTKSGKRVNWLEYLPEVDPASISTRPVKPKDRTQSMETIIREQTGDHFNIAEQTIKHLNQGQSDVSAAVQYENDQPHILNETQFRDFLQAYMIEPSQVFNYGDSTVPRYHVWSKLHDLDTQMTKLLAK